MNTNKPSLIVHYNKDTSKLAVPMMLFMIFLFSFFFLISLSFSSYLWPLLARTIQGIFLFIDVILIISVLHLIFFHNSDTPAAIINEEGMWVHYYNLIPWNNIADVTVRNSPGTPIEVVAVLPKEYRSLFKNATTGGKIAILIGKLFGYPSIQIANIEHDNEFVVDFAQQYMHK